MCTYTLMGRYQAWILQTDSFQHHTAATNEQATAPRAATMAAVSWAHRSKGARTAGKR